jgi:hypothetical protein
VKVVCLLNCPYCDAEIGNEETTICPNCGKSLEVEDNLPKESIDITQKQTDLVLAGAIFTIISAVIVISVGFIGVYQYLAWVDYYQSTVPPQYLGFLVFGISDIVFGLVAIMGGVFILKRKSFKVSILSIISLLASVIGTYIIIAQYQYGFTEILVLSEVSVFILSILSGALIFSSKTEFM